MTRAIRLAGAACLVAVSAAPARAQKPSANLHEIWSVLSDSGLFQSPRSLAVTSDCTVWIADVSTGVWRLSCNFGGTPMKVESDSAGPHHVQSPWLVSAFRGDTVAVWDQTAGVASLFAPGGTFLREQPPSLDTLSAGRPFALMFLNDGSWRAWTMSAPAGQGPRAESRAHVMSAGIGGNAADSIASMPGALSLRSDSAGAVVSIDAPMQRKPFISFFRNGAFLAGRNDRAQLDLFDSLGRHQRTIALPLPAPPRATKADRDAFADSSRRALERSMAAQSLDDSLRVRMRQMADLLVRDSTAYPDTRQQYDQLMLDEKEATVWVLLPAKGPDYGRTWLICSLTEFSYCRSQTIPHQGAVVAATIHGGAVYAIELTRDGMARVAKYDSQ